MIFPSSLKSARSRLAGLACAAGSLLALSACQHRTTNQTVTDWTHGLMGGEVYKLRPPPPNYDKPMPNINITPKYEPSFPSQDYRDALTENLQEHRNYAQRLSAATGPLPQKSPPPPPPPGNGENSSTLTSTDSKGSSAPARTAEKPTRHYSTETTGNLADYSDLPELKYHPISHETPHDLPAVGAPPPLPIGFGGFKIPPTPGTIRPDFDVKEPAGTLIRFATDTDQLAPDQENTLQQLADDSLHGRLVITGFGTTLSADAGLQPADQQQEITLGLLRAQTVAQELVKRHVPLNRITLQARPLGDGARIQILPLPAYSISN